MHLAGALALLCVSLGGAAAIGLAPEPASVSAAAPFYVPTGTAVNVSADGSIAPRFVAGTQVARAIGLWF